MTHRLVLAAAAIAACACSPAHAATFEFFEGNNCTQQKLGGLNTIDHRAGRDRITVLSRVFRTGALPIPLPVQAWNDEARSVRITSEWRRQQEPRTARVSLYDSPARKKTDDWVVVVVRDVTQIPAAGICVGSFERRFDRDGVFLERHPNNGLDGKISYIASDCNAACRADIAR